MTVAFLPCPTGANLREALCRPPVSRRGQDGDALLGAHILGGALSWEECPKSGGRQGWSPGRGQSTEQVPREYFQTTELPRTPPSDPPMRSSRDTQEHRARLQRLSSRMSFTERPSQLWFRANQESLLSAAGVRPQTPRAFASTPWTCGCLRHLRGDGVFRADRAGSHRGRGAERAGGALNSERWRSQGKASSPNSVRQERR